jgi:putative NADPH-quinone reductase
MRVMVVYAHPVENSFNAAIFATVQESLRAGGHEVDACDLYAENFPAIMSREDRLLYHKVPDNRALARPWIERLEAAKGLVLVFPTWLFAPPAILKGFCEKVFIPGIAFELVNGKTHGALHHLARVAGVSTYGGTRLQALLASDPPRKLLTRTMRAWVGTRTPVSFHACYDVDHLDERRGRTFLDKVHAAFARW